MKKKILITGSSYGVGKELTLQFLKLGWQVYGIARSDNSFKKYLNYTHLKVDISSFENTKKIIDSLNVKFDVLVNNASVFKSSKVNQISDEMINNIIDTNLKGTIFLTKYMIKKMKIDSRIIFINSVAGLSYINNQSIYAATKHGIKAFAKVLAEELRFKKIKISSIHPGGINTTLWNKTNPYIGGDIKDLLKPIDIFNLVHFIVNSRKNIEIPSITIFPDNEFH